jgi:hypothetical protein
MNTDRQKKLTRIFRKMLPESVRLPLASLCPWWEPANFLKSIYVHFTEQNVRQAGLRLEKIQGYYRGERCFIMGNGPSLNQMELDLLENDFVWASNKCYLLFERISWKPSFYVAVDKRVVPDIREEINRMILNLQETIFFFPVQFRVKSRLLPESNVYWYREVDSRPYISPQAMFTVDPSKWVSNVMTVTIAALQLAVYLGFDPIYLIGCDTSYSIPESVEIEDSNSEYLVSRQDDDPNHFDPNYFGTGSKWHAPHAEKMISHYAKAKKVCDDLDVSVYNATVGGKLEVFPRVNYRDLF